MTGVQTCALPIYQIDILNNSLLIVQTKNWIDKKEFEKFNQIFSCKNELDILGEFFFLIANIYSSENEFEKSNFYLNISNFLNPKFRFNLSLLAENYYNSENYRKSDKVLNNFNKNDDVYYWYKTKKKTRIFSKESGEQQAYNFIKDGWSIKQLHKLILTSSSWQMNSDYIKEKFDKDADNQLIWRYSPRKLEVLIDPI